MTQIYLGLRKQAEEKFPNDEKSQNEFVDGFITKVANILSSLDQFKSNLSYNGSIPTGRDTKLGDDVAKSFWSQGVAQTAGKVFAGGVAGLGMAGILGMAKVVSDHALHNNYLKALNEAIQTNRVLKGAEKHKVLNFGNTIFKFAPHVATDPNMLSSILANAIHGDGIDPMTIRTLTDLESRYQDLGSDKLFDPKRWT
jgi:hypothetical protein